MPPFTERHERPRNFGACNFEDETRQNCRLSSPDVLLRMHARPEVAMLFEEWFPGYMIGPRFVLPFLPGQEPATAAPGSRVFTGILPSSPNFAHLLQEVDNSYPVTEETPLKY